MFHHDELSDFGPVTCVQFNSINNAPNRLTGSRERGCIPLVILMYLSGLHSKSPKLTCLFNKFEGYFHSKNYPVVSASDYIF